MQFKKTTKRADRIGSELGVSYLLEGSVRTTGSRIRIAVQLIEAQSESHLWAEQYERDAKNLLTLQREVAEAITRQITTSLGVAPSNVNADARRHSTIAEAYEHYLRGRYHWWTGHCARDSRRRKEHFLKAIELDPSYALAYSGLADTYTLLGSDGFLPMSEAYPLGRAAALKALELDDTLGEAHNSLAAITVDYYWGWAEGGRHFERAIELNPNYETALRFYSFYLACMGRPEEALAFAERARRLDPVSPNAQMNLGVILYFARRYDEAITEIAETLELAPDFGPAHVLLGRVYVAKGMPDRAVEELERAQGLLGPRPDVITPHAYVLARAGRRREALAKLDELRRISKPRDPAPIRIAMVHIGLGDTDRAFEWLQKASRRGTGRWPCSRSNRPSMACGRIRALLRCSSAWASRDNETAESSLRWRPRPAWLRMYPRHAQAAHRTPRHRRPRSRGFEPAESHSSPPPDTRSSIWCATTSRWRTAHFAAPAAGRTSSCATRMASMASSSTRSGRPRRVRHG